jgi:hypothetical protein
MAAYISAADAIREEFGCAVIIVHHCGTDDSRPRGHSSLGAAVDVQLAVSREGACAQMTIEWMKEGAEGNKITALLEVVEVGVDADSEPITSCVMVPAQGDDLGLGKRKKLSHAARIALEALAEAICEGGAAQAGVEQIPEGVKVVGIEEWRRFAYGRGVSGSTEERARQQAFSRARQKLLDSRLIGVWNDLVWLADNDKASANTRTPL